MLAFVKIIVRNHPSVFLPFLTDKRLIIGLIIKRLWVFEPLSILDKKSDFWWEVAFL
jgi:hypothetical protein